MITLYSELVLSLWGLGKCRLGLSLMLTLYIMIKLICTMIILKDYFIVTMREIRLHFLFKYISSIWIFIEQFKDTFFSQTWLYESIDNCSCCLWKWQSRLDKLELPSFALGPYAVTCNIKISLGWYMTSLFCLKPYICTRMLHCLI